MVTDLGRDIIGFSGSPPPIGAPLSGTGILSGTQVTAVTGPGGTAATTTLATLGTIGDTVITVTSTTGISPGLVFDAGSGSAVTVTDVTNNDLTLSGPLTVQILGASQSYTGLTGTVSPSGGVNAVFTVSRSGSTYSATATTPGIGYSINNVITILGPSLSGTSTTNDATLTVTSASNKNTVSALNFASLVAGTGYVNTAVNNVATTGGTGTGLSVDILTDGDAVLFVGLNNPGAGYTIGDTITISGQGNGDATIQVSNVNAGGLIQAVSAAGTPITAASKNFISAFTISSPTTASIASGNTGVSYSAIATIEIAFASPHGFIPGDTITTSISSAGANAQLAAGPFFVEQVPTTSTLRYTARSSGGIDNTLVGIVYARPDSFFIHRPFDGGVQLGTASSSHGASAIRMSKKYIRYQSGKGVMYNTGALFAPSYDIRSLSATATTVGSIITLTTDDTDHGCQVGAQIVVSGVTTSGYNGVYTVTDISTERVLSVLAQTTLGDTTAILSGQSQMSVRSWHGSTIRAGIFDDQNGMFWQYDGIRMSVGRRSSTFQVVGTASVAANSNTVTGSNTRFTQQLAAGDRVVIRGMSHVVSQVISDTSMTVTPDYRGVSDVVNAKICKTVDIIIPQENWNLDTLNGAGASGYNIDVTRMQMIGIQHTWYGAGFIDFMLRGPEGNYVFAHRFRNSNVNTEAYMRTGNQPVRYEVINEGAKGRLSAAMTDIQTTVPMSAEDCYWFPTAGTVMIDNELIRYTGNTGTALTGCTRAASLVQFTAGSQRNFSAGTAASHTVRSGVILVSNTVTPNISHWGSAFMIDGQFDSDRGYIFNYAATGTSISTEKITAFLIRLAPSVSNAQVGDLGEKELLNRAQMLLTTMSITSDSVAGGGAIVVEGVLNPQNYPTDPTLITWTGLSSSAAGGQPSFAQIASGGSVSWGGSATTTTATVQGAFTTPITAKSFAAATQSLTAIAFNTTTQTVATPAITVSNSALYQFGFDTTRTDILITQSSYAALTTTLVAGDTITMPGGGALSTVSITGTAGQFTCASTTLYVGMTVTISGTITGGTGSITGYANPTTYRISVTNGTTTFTLTTTGGAAIVTSVGTPVGLTYTAANFIQGGRTVASVTPSYTTINSVVYARIVLTAAPGLTSATNTAVTGLIITSSLAATYNTAISLARTDFLVTQAQYAGTTVATQDVLSASTFITGSQTVGSITANYCTIAGTAYARIIMTSVGTATSTAGSGNTVAITSTSAVTALYGSALSIARSDFLITNTENTSIGGLAAGDVLSITSAASYTLTTVAISGSAGQFTCTASTLSVGMTVTISGTYGGSGSITGYVTPTTYRISATNGTTTFTLTTTAGVALSTGAGTPTGLTYTVGTFISSSQTILTVTPSYLTISTVPYTRIVMSAAANLSSTSGSGNDITVTVTAAGSAASYVTKNFLFFTANSWISSGATIGTKIAVDQTKFAAGTSVAAISTRTYGATTVYRVTFTQTSNATYAAADTLKFQFGAAYALPGEQVFSFVSNPGSTDTLDLTPLKELTATTIGGRGAFPNGPDVLAINIYKVSGSATPANLILRWSEAQA